MHEYIATYMYAQMTCILYAAKLSRGKLSRLAKKLQKPRKFPPSKVLPYTVYECTFVRTRVYMSVLS